MQSNRTQTLVRPIGIGLGELAVALLAHPLYLEQNMGTEPVPSMLFVGSIRSLITILGAFLLTYAALAVSRNRWRPVTPWTAVLFPLTNGLAVLGLQWYDQVVLGIVGVQPLDDNPALLVALSFVFMVGGSLVRRKQRRAAAGFLLGCLALFLLGVIVDQTRPPIALVSGVALGVAGVILGAIGYGLTDRTSPVAPPKSSRNQ